MFLTLLSRSNMCAVATVIFLGMATPEEYTGVTRASTVAALKLKVRTSEDELKASNWTIEMQIMPTVKQSILGLPKDSSKNEDLSEFGPNLPKPESATSISPAELNQHTSATKKVRATKKQFTALQVELTKRQNKNKNSGNWRILEKDVDEAERAYSLAKIERMTLMEKLLTKTNEQSSTLDEIKNNKSGSWSEAIMATGKKIVSSYKSVDRDIDYVFDYFSYPKLYVAEEKIRQAKRKIERVQSSYNSAEAKNWPAAVQFYMEEVIEEAKTELANAQAERAEAGRN